MQNPLPYTDLPETEKSFRYTTSLRVAFMLYIALCLLSLSMFLILPLALGSLRIMNNPTVTAYSFPTHLQILTSTYAPSPIDGPRHSFLGCTYQRFYSVHYTTIPSTAYSNHIVLEIHHWVPFTLLLILGLLFLPHRRKLRL